jgi:hypothetical protein
MNNLSVHDNVLVGYEVHCVRRVITFHTEYRDQEPLERTAVTFKGVEAYHFAGDNLLTILFDITKVTVEQILNDFAAEFQKGINYSWPGPWNKSPAACLLHFQEQNCKGWRIDSSFGASGFVIARAMELKPG